MSGDLIRRKFLIENIMGLDYPTSKQQLVDLITNAPAVEKSEPIAWLRYRNGEIDWSEDCLGAAKGESLSCYDEEDSDEYSEKPLYTAPPQPQTARDALEKAALIAEKYSIGGAGSEYDVGMIHTASTIREEIRALIEEVK